MTDRELLLSLHQKVDSNHKWVKRQFGSILQNMTMMQNTVKKNHYYLHEVFDRTWAILSHLYSEEDLKQMGFKQDFDWSQPPSKKYLAAPTRRTTITTVGTGLPNHCLHRDNWFYFLNPSISSLPCCVLDRYCLKTLTKDFLNFLSSISSVSLSSVCLSCVYALCTLCLFSFHHDDCDSVLLCVHMSTYSTASSSWLRNFLTLKFLSDEFVKITYSPPL